jgi:hypothetical protein
MCRCSLLLDMRHLFRYTLSYEGQVWLQHEDNKPLADYLREINPFESFGGLDYDGTTESASFGNNRLPSRMPSLPPFNVPESAEMRCGLCDDCLHCLGSLVILRPNSQPIPHNK